MGELPEGALGGHRGGVLWKTIGDARKAAARVAEAEGLA